MTLQDIFEYKLDKSQAEIGGTLMYTGLRPVSGKFERNGVRLPSWMEEHNFGDERSVPERPVAAFGGRPSRVDTRRMGR